MNIQDRIAALEQLGLKIDKLTNEEWSETCRLAMNGNAWFTDAYVRSAILGIRKFLDRKTLENWTSKYTITDQRRIVGLVMAGNIPLVGFHDLMTVFISGNKAAVKTSSLDEYLMTQIICWLAEIDPRTIDLIQKVDRLNHIDAVIATGSDNSARYFKYYFKDKPHIIRQNRSSVAILTNEETDDELLSLADDAFQYFGLGCRNVSKLYVPKGYSFKHLLDVWSDSPYKVVLDHYKYANNYTYNKSILLINKVDHFDTGFLILQEHTALVSPTSVIYFEYYETPQQLQFLLAEKVDKIQCVVGKADWLEGLIPFGLAQSPDIDDYADGVDTMEFLCGLR